MLCGLVVSSQLSLPSESDVLISELTQRKPLWRSNGTKCLCSFGNRKWGAFLCSRATTPLSPPPTQPNLSVWFQLELHKQQDYARLSGWKWFWTLKSFNGVSLLFVVVTFRQRIRKSFLTAQQASYSLTPWFIMVLGMCSSAGGTAVAPHVSASKLSTR